jgi:hypothetical protein
VHMLRRVCQHFHLLNRLLPRDRHVHYLWRGVVLRWWCERSVYAVPGREISGQPWPIQLQHLPQRIVHARQRGELQQLQRADRLRHPKHLLDRRLAALEQRFGEL